MAHGDQDASYGRAPHADRIALHREPGQAVGGRFVAAAVRGRYDFSCRLPGHDVRGLSGTIVVR